MGDAEYRSTRERKETYLFPSVITYYKDPLLIVRGEGAYLYDHAGRGYLDFFAGILTVSLGHCHPEVTERVTEQLRTLQHTSTLYLTAPIVDLAERLARLTPGRLQKCFFVNSGTEADETAVAIARTFTGADDIIALRHGYSGRSALGMNLTGHSPWRQSAPALPAIRHAVSPYCYRCPLGLTYPSCEIKCAKDIEELIQTTTPGRIAGFLAEPIQGIGGFITPPVEYFQVAVGIIRRYGGIFLCDEVQTGFGRTGTMFGIEHYGIEPEVMTFAKALGNGFPIGAVIAVPEVADSFTGLTISTFGGNPVAATAALATLDVIAGENLAKNAAELGAYFREGLEELQQRYPLIGDVRGKGLMQGLELVRDRKSKEPADTEATRLFEETKARGLLIGKGGLYGNCIRLSPPLTITKSHVDDALRILDASLSALAP